LVSFFLLLPDDPAEANDDGRKSWPSGHTSLSFATMSFLSFWLSAKCGLFTNHRRRGMLGIVLLCMAPYILSFFIAASRIYDYWHHPSDINTGIIIGLLCSLLGSSQFFHLDGSPVNRIKSESE
jgi:diacylglycerol diphosphate phosphatase/phosphatidate phosphatase